MVRRWSGLSALQSSTPVGVSCPRCRAQELTVRFSCLQTSFLCTDCRHLYDLAELFRSLTATDFDTLAALVEDRHSDRV